MKRVVVSSMIFFVLIAPALFTGSAAQAEETLGQNMENIQPGMARDSVFAILGRPDAVVTKFLNSDKKITEVWRYDAVKDPNPPWRQWIGKYIPAILLEDNLSPEVRTQLKAENPPYLIVLVDEQVKKVLRGTEYVPDK